MSSNGVMVGITERLEQEDIDALYDDICDEVLQDYLTELVGHNASDEAREDLVIPDASKPVIQSITTALMFQREELRSDGDPVGMLQTHMALRQLIEANDYAATTYEEITRVWDSHPMKQQGGL